jgi:hypothetical protein
MARRLVALECPTCGARFTRDEYVTHWLGDTEEDLERQLRATLARLGMRCDECKRPVSEFKTVWSERA